MNISFFSDVCMDTAMTDDYAIPPDAMSADVLSIDSSLDHKGRNTIHESPKKVSAAPFNFSSWMEDLCDTGLHKELAVYNTVDSLVWPRRDRSITVAVSDLKSIAPSLIPDPTNP